MEAHFVHQADDGSLAVLGVLYREGNTANKNIAVIVANLPWQKGQTLQFSDLSLELNPHLPE